MAVVVIFGLAIATVLTLVVVPTLYVTIEETRLKMSSVYSRITSLGKDRHPSQRQDAAASLETS